MPDVKGFGEALGHEFRQERWPAEALTHASLTNEPAGRGRVPNTRLEYVGDAVLELAVRAVLMDRFDRDSPGLLDKAKQAVVANDKLGPVIRDLGLGRFLERGGSRPPDSDKVLAQLFEASVGAVFLDAGFDAARRVVERHAPFPNSLQPPVR